MINNVSPADPQLVEYNPSAAFVQVAPAAGGRSEACSKA